MKYRVDFSRVSGQLSNPKRIPKKVAESLLSWAEIVEKLGLPNAQRVQRYRDHGLQGDRFGQRSFWINFKWRAIYSVNSSGELIIVRIEEVTAHDYRKK
jgi:addiction module RelE/StbE family toxin